MPLKNPHDISDDRVVLMSTPKVIKWTYTLIILSLYFNDMTITSITFGTQKVTVVKHFEFVVMRFLLVHLGNVNIAYPHIVLFSNIIMNLTQKLNIL